LSAARRRRSRQYAGANRYQSCSQKDRNRLASLISTTKNLSATLRWAREPECWAARGSVPWRSVLWSVRNYLCPGWCHNGRHRRDGPGPREWCGVGVAGLAFKLKRPLSCATRLIRVQPVSLFPAELQKNVNDRAQKYWKLGTGQSATVVTIELQGFAAAIKSRRGDQLCRSGTGICATARCNSVRTRLRRKKYEYVGTFSQSCQSGWMKAAILSTPSSQVPVSR